MKRILRKQFRKPDSETSERGAALLIVLAVLAILSVVLLGFLASMDLESTSSHAVESSYRTKMVAHGALSHAIELLRSNIPDPTPLTKTPSSSPKQNWATNPGRLTLISGSGSQEYIPLHSGEAPNPEEDVVFEARSTDINRPLPGRSRAPIANGDEVTARPEMRVAWIPVLQDPSKDAGPANQMTARYAFWIDDETSKLNTSVALGKTNPEILEKDSPENWKEQLDSGWVTPVFKMKTREQLKNPKSGPSGGINVSLGHPWSVNFDTLFDDEDEFPIDLVAMYHEARVHGFQRYPDAILHFIDMPGDEKRKWYDENLWNITFYNRAPEFNAFGFSRLFTLREPTPLTTGPAYQTPFTQNGNAQLQALYGFQMTSDLLGNADGRKQLTEVTLASGKNLLRYLKEKWPGQSQSFSEKYGTKEARQMVLNMLLMSRFATGGWGDGNMAISDLNRDGYANLIAGMSYFGESGEGIEELGTPEKYYWRLNDDFEFDRTEPPMLPQSPGPHLNEIKFVVEPEEVIIDNKRYIQFKYHYEVEYYIHPEGPFGPEGTGDNSAAPQNSLPLPFPVKVDYLKLEADDHVQKFDDKDWDSENLNKLATNSANDLPEIGQSRYPVASSRSFLLTEDEASVEGGNRVLFDPIEKASLKFKVILRLGVASGIGSKPMVKQMVPLGTDPEATLQAEFDIDLSVPDPEYFVSWEVKDPRVSWHKDDWKMRVGEDSWTSANSNQPKEPEASEYDSFKYVRITKTTLDERSEKAGDSNPTITSFYGDEFQGDTRFPSAGYLSMLHTGIQNRDPWKTFNLGAESGGFPDWVLMDLIGATFPLRHGEGINGRSLSDHWMSLSYMNSTAGKVNLNNKIYPDNEWFKAPKRTKPLKAVFRYMRDDSDIDSLVENILQYQNGGKAFEYVGQFSEVTGYAKGDTNWEKETLLRNMANCLTTQSNTFGVWGVAQTVKKSRGSEQFDQFEKSDAVLSEKRFYAMVERYVWPGRDGVPGNGHTDYRGDWDRLAKSDAVTGSASPKTVPGDLPTMGSEGEFALIDGPDSVSMAHSELFAEQPHRSSPLSEADNPAGAFVKYRILYFKFLDH